MTLGRERARIEKERCKTKKISSMFSCRQIKIMISNKPVSQLIEKCNECTNWKIGGGGEY